MEGETSLVTAVVLALAGALHCGGMCGPLALAACSSHKGPWQGLTNVLLFVVGKSLGYASLGVLAAKGGALLLQPVPTASVQPALQSTLWLAHFRAGLALVAGVAMILFGLRMLGCPAPFWPPLSRASALLARPFRQLWLCLAALPPTFRPFGFGAAASLLPCGLSWTAIALAIGAGSAQAALQLAFFGLATAPALCMGVLGWHWLSPARVLKLRACMGLALVALGLFTLWRGSSLLPGQVHTLLPDCCQDRSESSLGGG